MRAFAPCTGAPGEGQSCGGEDLESRAGAEAEVDAPCKMGVRVGRGASGSTVALVSSCGKLRISLGPTPDHFAANV